MKLSNRSQFGFTLIELLIVVAILGLVSALSIPFTQIFWISSDIATLSEELSSALRRAQLQARTGQNNADWGVSFDDTAKRYTVFQGESYAGRDSSFDYAVQYPPRFGISSDFGSEIIFLKFSGMPTASGTISIIDTQSNAGRAVIINGLGLVNYD